MSEEEPFLLISSSILAEHPAADNFVLEAPEHHRILPWLAALDILLTASLNPRLRWAPVILCLLRIASSLYVHKQIQHSAARVRGWVIASSTVCTVAYSLSYLNLQVQSHSGVPVRLAIAIIASITMGLAQWTGYIYDYGNMLSNIQVETVYDASFRVAGATTPSIRSGMNHVGDEEEQTAETDDGDEDGDEDEDEDDIIDLPPPTSVPASVSRRRLISQSGLSRSTSGHMNYGTISSPA